tara:strand:- start:1720 stop:2352 length:633 start_codon:yes stop_codon:yes gene_type:complete
MIKNIFCLVAVFLPWPMKYVLYKYIFRWDVDYRARVGMSFINANQVSMAKGALIKNLTIVRGVNYLKMGESSRVGNLNWISSSQGTGSLILNEHSAVTNRHYIDCTADVKVGRFSTLAGVKSTILTHSIDVYKSKQTSFSVSIGDYCFIGTGVILLAGCEIENNVVIGGGALVTGHLEEANCLYAGVPARMVKPFSGEVKYFERTTGYVD